MVYVVVQQFFYDSHFLILCEHIMSKSFDDEYEDAKENEDETIPESVVQETLPFSAEELLIIPETQVDSVIPETQVDTFSPPRGPVVFPAFLLDSVVLPICPEPHNHDSLCPPPLPLVRESVIQ